jgi:hypothetical protein
MSWASEELNLGPHAYQACALTRRYIRLIRYFNDLRGIFFVIFAFPPRCGRHFLSNPDPILTQLARAAEPHSHYTGLRFPAATLSRVKVS